MLANSITLAVDEANTGTTTDAVFTRQDEFQNHSRYTGPGHSLDSRDTLDVYRTYPTRNGNYRGVAKSSLKFTLDLSVAGVDSTTSLISPLIVELSMSKPLGVSDADVVEARQRVLAALDDDTLMNQINNDLTI